MKRMKPFKLFCIFVISISLSCSEKEDTQMVINPETFVQKEVQLSDYADEVVYVPLSSEMPLRRIKSLKISSDLIFIGARSEGLLVFNRDGSFKTQIGRKGEGPGEYYSVSTFSLDHQNKLVYVLDVVARKKVLVYSFDGTFKYEFFNDQFEGNFQKIAYHDDKVYLFEMIIGGNAKYNWVELDTRGNLISEKTNSVLGFKAMITVMINPVYEYNNGIAYWNQYNDTVFQIKNGKHSAAYLFAEGNHRLPQNNSMDLDGCFMKNNIIESDKYLWIGEFKRPKNNVIIVDKKSGESIFIEVQEKDENILPGLINDIDGGVNFEPKEYFKENDNEYLVGWTDAYQLKAYSSSESFKNSVPELPEKKKELKKLSNNLNENDNPVLILVKLKE